MSEDVRYIEYGPEFPDRRFFCIRTEDGYVRGAAISEESFGGVQAAERLVERMVAEIRRPEEPMARRGTPTG